MSDHRDHPQPAAAEDSSSASDARLQRRRVLLSALGKGGAVLAASVPLAAKAIPATGTVLVTNPGGSNNRLCTVSGVGSLVASNVPNGSACNALSAAHYVSAAQWPSPYRKADIVAPNPNPGPATTANALLSTSDFTAGRTALDVLQTGTAIEAAWVAAALNAVEPSPNAFPYALGQVQAHFANRSNADVDKFYRVLFGLP